MREELKHYVFMPIDGTWTDVKGTGEILAGVLQQYDLLVDDKCEFARFYDYANGRCIWYRVIGTMRIEINVYKIGED